MKKVLSFLLVCTMFCGFGRAHGEPVQQKNCKLYINGVRSILFDQDDNQMDILLMNSVFYVPLEALVAAVGGTYEYDEHNNIIRISLEVSEKAETDKESNALSLEAKAQAKQIYESLCNVASRSIEMGKDICVSMNYGLTNTYANRKLPNYSVFSGMLNVSEEYLYKSITSSDIYVLNAMESPNTCMQMLATITKVMPFYQWCVVWVMGAFDAAGYYGSNESDLGSIESGLKELKTVYGDTSNYDALLALYTDVHELSTFVELPEGTYEEIKSRVDKLTTSIQSQLTMLALEYAD